MPGPPRALPRARQRPQRLALRNLLANPVAGAVYRRPPPSDRLLPQLIGELLALQELAQGAAGPRAWQDLRDMLLIALELARAGIGPELAGAAADALVLLRDLARCPPPWRLLGADLQVLVDLQAAHDAQRRLATEGELIEANLAAMKAA